MEPFALTVSQVNFEEKELGAPEDDLSSFSNIVSYDSDFKEEDKEGRPVLPRMIQISPSESDPRTSLWKINLNLLSTNRLKIH